MEPAVRTFLLRILRKIPTGKLEETLKQWTHLTKTQLQSLDYSEAKWILHEHIVSFCQENGATMRQVSELEMIYYMETPKLATWRACHLLQAEDDASSVELVCFKEQFKAHLSEMIRNVSIKIKKDDDEAIWIRIAWGDAFSKPNHLKPTYVVHYLQTPYVFICNLSAKNKLLLFQALVRATRHGCMKDANLSGQSFRAIRDMLMGQYRKTFSTNHPRPLKERTRSPTHPNIVEEQMEQEERRHQLACEVFGEGQVPKLENATYRLETRLRCGSGGDTLTEDKFKSLVTFTSKNLLESLRHCVASGMTDSISPLLSSITQKGRNVFFITDKTDNGHDKTKD